MRVSTLSISNTVIKQIQQLGSQQSKLQVQVATGQRIFNPGDDPTAVGRVLNLESESRSLLQYERNIDRAMELSQASYSALREMKKVSDRAGEIGALGAGVTSPEASRAYASEVNQLIEQAVQLANTRFRNDYMFAGTAVDAPPYTATRDANGQITDVAFVGNADRTAISLSETTNVTPGTDNATNTGVRDFINGLVELRDALTANDGPAVIAAQGTLLAGEDVLVNGVAEQGGIQTRIEASRTLLTSRTDDIQKLISAEADIDLPEAVVRLNQALTSYQAALQSSASIMRLSLLDYIS
jgi:flagellar hook-associated protein 3 FlgL